jgi:site-specific DNA-methyltransferase (adenine-specific)
MLRELPSVSVDGLVCDPPYSSGGAFRGDRTADPKTKYVTSDAASQGYLPTFAGDNRDQRAYGYWCALWLGEALRIVRPGRAAVLFTDWRQLPTTTDALQAGGWVWRGVAPWIKPDARPQMGRFGASAEYVVWGTAGASLDDEALGCIPGYHVERAPRGVERVHPTQKPTGAMEWALRVVPAGGVVLDPFAGSGSTGVAALATGRTFIGCELTEANAETCARRLEQQEHDGQPQAMFGGVP